MLAKASPKKQSSSWILSKFNKKYLLWFAAFSFTFGTGFALYQPVHPDPLHQHDLLDSFIYPQEENAFLRQTLINQSINEITTVEGQLWAVGKGGLILHSSDGGLCWIPAGPWVVTTTASQCPQPKTGLQRIFSDLSANLDTSSLLNKIIPQAYAADTAAIKNKKLNTYKLNTRRPSKEPELNTQKNFFPNDVIQSKLPVLSSKTKTPVKLKASIPAAELNIIPNLNSIAFVDKNTGVAVGDKGIILKTEDAGKSWLAIDSGINERLSSIAFSSNNQAIISGYNGTILYSSDIGTSWTVVESGSTNWLLSVAYSNTNQAFAVGRSGTLLRSENAGKTWLSINSNTTNRLLSIAFSSNKHALAVGDKGTILYSGNDGESWDSVESDTINRLRSITFITENQVLIVGDKGTVLGSRDSGKTWNTIDPGTDVQLRSITHFNKNQLLTVGNNGTILRSIDDGQSWISMATANPGISPSNSQAISSTTRSSRLQSSQYSVSLAHWWYLLLASTMLLVLFTVWPRVEPSEDDGIAGLAASDKPLQPGDPDALNLSAIASDITAFLSNPKTTAPLTMAITGPWGCGKSSLMNLVRADLKEKGFSPVWFNAWHHQKGEQLLASLFAHIKQQAIPGWFSFDGLWFRLKLAFIRGYRHWFMFAILLSLLFMTLALNRPSLSKLFLELSQLSDPGLWWHFPWDNWTPGLNSFFQTGDWIQTLASIFGIGTPLVALLRSVRGFGISPKRLVSIDHGRDSQKGYDPGARARFASEFKDVTRALGNNKMVIFIDDLDRCSQDNLIDILENINFISSSGDCFMLLGMAPKYIEACVANHYETLAKSIAEKDKYESSNHSDNQETHKFRFAHNYLEKMINIEVTVPQMHTNSIDKLINIKSQEDKKISLRAFFNTSFNSLNKAMNIIVPVLVILLAIGYGWEYGRKIPDKPKQKSNPVFDLWPADKQTLLSLSMQDSSSLLSQSLIKKQLELSDNNKQLEPLKQFSIAIQANKKQLEKGLKIGSIGKGKNKAGLLLKLNAETGKPKVITSTSNQKQSASSISSDQDLQTKAAEFRQASFESNTRFSTGWFILGLIIFISFTSYLYRKKTEKYAKDSDDFKQSLSLWTPWIQLKQETPRAIKRFLNHLRFLSIRNNRELNESILVAMATIYFYNQDWLLDETKFHLLCEQNLEALLAEDYQLQDQSKDQQATMNAAITNLSHLLGQVLEKINTSELSDNRDLAIKILKGAMPGPGQQKQPIQKIQSEQSMI